jgi:hypothetical protein
MDAEGGSAGGGDMKLRMVISAMAVILVIHGSARAAGILYRRNNQRWADVFSGGDALTSGVFTGRIFATPSSSTRAAAANLGAGICGAGAIRIAAFSAKVSGSAPNTGIFLYDQVNGTMNDGVSQGTATPITGFFDQFGGTNPSVTIDSASCTLHVVFRGRATGVTSTSDTGIFDATFGPLPALTLIGITTLVQEGVTAAPAPFPGGALFSDFPDGLPVPAQFASGALGFAFRGQVAGAGVTSSDDTGIFISNGTLSTLAREGDGTNCAPSWTGAGVAYADFSNTLQLDIGFSSGNFGALYRAKSTGGASGSDSALEFGQVGGGCGVTTKVAVEGQGTVAGGTYGDFGATTGLSFAANGTPNAAFLATIVGLAGIPRAVFYTDLTTPVVVARHGMADSALGSGKVSLSSDANPTVNDGGTVVFKASVSGYASGLFVYSSAITPPELLSFSGRAPVIDTGSNITARFP